MESTYDQLIEMGFLKSKVEKAIKCTNNEGLQSAIDWLVSHNDDEEIDNDIPMEAAVSSSTEENALKMNELTEGDKEVPSAKSMKCDDCGKLLLTEADVQLHASRMMHTNFSESVEEIKPLTEEEKKLQIEKLQEKMKQKRLEREAQEAKENLERERNRRKQGKTIIDAKTKFEEDELKRLAEQKRREKEEDRLYREKLKNQIANDREIRNKNLEISKSKEVPPASKPLEMKPPSGNYDTCRIQIRHAQGSQLMETFSPNDSLSKVASFFAQKTGLCGEKEVEFRTTMPPKLYGSDCMGKTVKELGFCPSIVLMAVIKKSIS